MSIFKDLGFMNQSGELTSPDCNKINGLTVNNLLNNCVNTLTFVPDSDGQISILGSVLPTSITQVVTQNDWRKYQAKAVNLNGKLFINNKEQTVLSTTKNKVDFFGDNSSISTYLFNNNLNDSKGTYHLRVYNDGIDYVDSKFGKCVSFNGISQHMTIPRLIFGPNVTFSSFSFWMNYIGVNQRSIIYNEAADLWPTLIIGINTSNKLYFQVHNGTSWDIHDNITPILSGWNNYYFSFVGTTLKIYINGALITTFTTFKQHSSTNNGVWCAGRTGTTALAGLFNGQLDNIRVFNRTLTAAEVVKLYEEDTTTFAIEYGRDRALSVSVDGSVDKVYIDTWLS